MRTAEGWAPLTTRGADRRPRRGRATGPARARDAARPDPDPRRRRGCCTRVTVPLERTYALRWTGHDATLRPSLALEVAQAADFDAFRTAVLQVACPGQNFVYADVDGHIGYQCTGRHPVRAQGDGTRPVPGWDGRPRMERLDRARGPSVRARSGRGWLATANNDVQPPRIPPPDLERLPRAEPARSDRRAAGSDATSTTSPRCSRSSSTPSRSPAPRAPRHLSALEPHTDAQRDALGSLRAWDGDLRADSRRGGAVPGLDQRDRSAPRCSTTGLGPEICSPRTTASARRSCAAVLPDMLANDRGSIDDALRGALDDAIEEVAGRNVGRAPPAACWRTRSRGSPGSRRSSSPSTIPLGGDEQTVAQAGFDGAARLPRRP